MGSRRFLCYLKEDTEGLGLEARGQGRGGSWALGQGGEDWEANTLVFGSRTMEPFVSQGSGKRSRFEARKAQFGVQGSQGGSEWLGQLWTEG